MKYTKYTHLQNISAPGPKSTAMICLNRALASVCVCVRAYHVSDVTMKTNAGQLIDNMIFVPTVYAPWFSN